MAHPRIALAQIDTCVGRRRRATPGASSTGPARPPQAGRRTSSSFPEMTITGYPIEDLALRDSFRRGAEARAAATSRPRWRTSGLGDLAVVVGTVGEP